MRGAAQLAAIVAKARMNRLRLKKSLSGYTKSKQCKASFPQRQHYRHRIFYLSVVRFADWGAVEKPSLLQASSGILRLSHKLEYSCEQPSRWWRMLSEIMASQHLTPSPPSPLPLGEGCRGEGKELLRQPQDSCRRSRTASSTVPLGAGNKTKKWVAIAGTTTRLRKKRNNLLLGAAKLHHGLSLENGFELLL